MDKPLLRNDIQLVSMVVEGRRVIRFIDPLQMSDNQVALDIGLVPLLQMLDGRHTLRDIQTSLMRRQGGRLLYVSDIQDMLDVLDKAYLLENGAFHDRIRSLRREFSSRSDREPHLAGTAYPSNPDGVRKFVEEVETQLGICREINEKIRGIMAPHIDIRTAGKSYVGLYRHLKGRRFDRVIIMGINHKMQDGLYSLSEKDYATPLGKLRSDRPFIEELKKKVPSGALSVDDFSHKIEHSIEFQTLFLRYYLGDGIRIVPILCGGIHEFFLHGKDLLSDPRFLETARAIENTIDEFGGDTLFVSGVDLAHIGLKFGGRVPAQDILPLARANDEKILSHVVKGETREIYELAVNTGDRFNVCGLPAILLHSFLMRGRKAQILSYETYDERETGSAVNYASVVFTD
ncbi:MAG: AmmeMemoRadiSam system protein B [Syntrophales bacterium]